MRRAHDVPGPGRAREPDATARGVVDGTLAERQLGDDERRFSRKPDPEWSRRPPQGPGDGGNSKSFIKGFAAGLLFAHFNKHLVLGALVGVTAGMYYEQEFGAPDVKQKYEEISTQIKDIFQPPKK